MTVSVIFPSLRLTKGERDSYVININETYHKSMRTNMQEIIENLLVTIHSQKWAVFRQN